jgi:hypothetical protein
MYHHGADVIHGMCGATQQLDGLEAHVRIEREAQKDPYQDPETDAIIGCRKLIEHAGLNKYQAQAVLGYLLDRYRRESYAQGEAIGGLISGVAAGQGLRQLDSTNRIR